MINLIPLVKGQMINPDSIRKVDGYVMYYYRQGDIKSPDIERFNATDPIIIDGSPINTVIITTDILNTNVYTDNTYPMVFQLYGDEADAFAKLIPGFTFRDDGPDPIALPAEV